MQSLQLARPSFDALAPVDVPDPGPPVAGHVLVRMKAGSLNYADLAVASGRYPGVTLPTIALCDGAGEVIATGAGVWQVKVGDRVALAVKPRWVGGPTSAEVAGAMRGATLPGSLVEVAMVDAASVVKAPDHLSWEEIGTLPIAAMTAWRALGDSGPGDTVVTLGTGGVSIFALQLAKARGARVLVTSSSDEKLARVRALGADATFNYRADPAWDAFVLAETGGRGADLVIDPVAGAGFARSLAAVRHGGTVAFLGFLGGGTAEIDLLPILFKEIRIQGANGGSVHDLAAAVRAIAAHRIQPVIDRTFSSRELEAAYRHMASGAHLGKIAIRFDWA